MFNRVYVWKHSSEVKRINLKCFCLPTPERRNIQPEIFKTYRECYHTTFCKGLGIIFIKYRDEIYSLQNLLSRTQAGPGRTVMKEQEQISPNHVQRINLISVTPKRMEKVSVLVTILGLLRWERDLVGGGIHIPIPGYRTTRRRPTHLEQSKDFPLVWVPQILPQMVQVQ